MSDRFRRRVAVHLFRAVVPGDDSPVQASAVNGVFGVLHEILLDLNMPRKDGREALREIKSDPVLRRYPVVVLTTSHAEEDVVRSYELGVNSFITKPVTFQGLLEAVKILGRYWFEIVELPNSRKRKMGEEHVSEPAYGSGDDRGVEADGGMAAVTDTGSGISPEVLPHIGARQGHRVRAAHRVRHRQAERRLHLGVQRSGAGHRVQGVSAARRPEARFAVCSGSGRARSSRLRDYPPGRG